MSSNPSSRSDSKSQCPPGSIEQQLDMCESGPLRGDEISFSHGSKPTDRQKSEKDWDLSMNENFNLDMADGSREGDEASGDEHSSGLQGDEPELLGQPFPNSGMPGDENQGEEDPLDQIERKRIA